MMDKTIKRRWIDALLSNKYKQGADWLHNADNDEYCCLGVLCHILADELQLQVTKEAVCLDYEAGPRTITTFNGRSHILPDAVAGIVGSEDPSVRSGVGKIEQPLSVLNDNGMTFSELANLIEEQL